MYFEQRDFNEVDWDTLDKFKDRTIFQTKEWLQFVSTTQNADPVIAVIKEDNEIIGYFTGLIIKKLGVKILGSPFAGWNTNYMGFNFFNEVDKSKVIQELQNFVFKYLNCQFIELVDTKLGIKDCIGFDYKSMSGYEIDLRQDEEKLLSNMKSACRRCIRKAKKSGVIIEHAKDISFADEYYNQLIDVFAKQKLVPTYNKQRVVNLIKYLHPTNRLLLLKALNQDGICIATGIFPAMNESMYFFGGASLREYQILRPNEAIMWYAMKYWKSHGIKYFDMCGGGEYKEKYGSYKKKHIKYFKAKYKLLLYFRNYAEKSFYIRTQIKGVLKK